MNQSIKRVLGVFVFIGNPSIAAAQQDVQEVQIAQIQLQAGGNEENHDDQRTLEVTGKVTDRTTGEPLAKFRVIPTSVAGMDEPGPYTWQSHLMVEATGGELHWKTERPWQFTRLRIEAEGYRPALTPIFSAEKRRVTLNIQMNPDPGITGQIVDAMGTAIAGTGLAIGTQTLEIRVNRGELQLMGHAQVLGQIARSDELGHFQLPAEIGEWWLVAAHPVHGYAEVKSQDVMESPPIVLQPWSKIEGQLKTGNASGGELVGFSAFRPTQSNSATTYISDEKRVDENGSFQFDHVPPGQIFVQRWFPLGDGGKVAIRGLSLNVTAIPGEVTRVDLSGPGRTLVGRVQMPEVPTILESETLTVLLRIPAPHIGMPGDEKIWEVYQEFLNTDEGKRYNRDGIPVNDAGTFRIDDVPAGEFELRVLASDESGNNRRYVGYLPVNVPPSSAATRDTEDDVVDVGVVELQ